ncbi:MAG: GNAT family N-acetyltransferase [Albidovulum sp.]
MKITLRSGQPGDGRTLFEVTGAAVDLAASHYPPEVIANWMHNRSPAYYEERLSTGHIVIAERGGAALGFVQAVPGEVTRLFVRPEAAGQGLGARLLALGVKLACDGAPRAITLEATLNAQAFYERLGFVADRQGWYSGANDGVPVAVVYMHLDEDHYPSYPRQAADILRTLS